MPGGGIRNGGKEKQQEHENDMSDHIFPPSVRRFSRAPGLPFALPVFYRRKLKGKLLIFPPAQLSSREGGSVLSYRQCPGGVVAGRSSRIVTGPSFIISTSIRFPNDPDSTARDVRSLRSDTISR